jgi:hypothetical protein
MVSIMSEVVSDAFWFFFWVIFLACCFRVSDDTCDVVSACLDYSDLECDVLLDVICKFRSIDHGADGGSQGFAVYSVVIWVTNSERG